MTQITYIYAARFQPFHRDHLQVIMEFLAHNSMPLVVAVVRPLRTDWLNQDQFDDVGDEHHKPARNPFSAVQVMSMVNAALFKAGVAERTLLTVLPRPSHGRSWELIEQLFPQPRSWVIPQRGESWDESKALFFQQQGDSVLRISVPRTTSGQAIRANVYEQSRPAIESVPLGAKEVLRDLLHEEGNGPPNAPSP